MARARTDVAEPKLFQKRPNIPLVVINAKPALDDALKVNAPPAHDAIGFSVGTYVDDDGEFSPLLHRQARLMTSCPVI
jgi:hypothetical protein